VTAGWSAGCDEIGFETLKPVDREEVLWLTRVCKVAWFLWKGI